jgi:hypothetical protein
MKGSAVERMDRFDEEEGTWREAVVEDRRTGTAETAAAKIDIGDWFRLLPERDQKIAGALAIGGTTGEVAQEFGLSPGRVSQKRHELEESWEDFQGEEADEEAAIA